MGCDVGGRASYSAHWVTVVAVVEEDTRVLLESFELFGCACAPAIVVYAFADSEILVLVADNSTECYCCNDYNASASHLVEVNRL